MPIPESLRGYAAELGYPDSETLARIFEVLFEGDDVIEAVAALPGTAEEVADKTGLNPRWVTDTLTRLVQEGSIIVDFVNFRVFRRFPALIFLRDSSVHGPNTTQEMFELWDRLVLKESADMVQGFKQKNVPAGMRVIPIEKTVESQNTVLDVDSARKIFSEAKLITAAPCVCRTVAKKNRRGQDCPAPEEAVCMQTNLFATGLLARKIGEKLSTEEALRRIGIAEDAGLVHMVRNNVARDMFMCNCCSCCCTGFDFFARLDYPGVFAPSRFRVKVEEELCSGCGECEPRCQFEAITVDGKVSVDLDMCYGCGNCALVCPDEALVLEEVRPLEHIRVVRK